MRTEKVNSTNLVFMRSFKSTRNYNYIVNTGSRMQTKYRITVMNELNINLYNISAISNAFQNITLF